MGQVFQFIRRPLDVFDPAMLTILGKAYDKALGSLRYRGQPLIVRETMAVRIFELASQGERDPNACATPRSLPLAHGCRPAQSAPSPNRLSSAPRSGARLATLYREWIVLCLEE
jgi:hypothetical protein